MFASSTQKATPYRFLPGLEALEDRTVLNATFNPAALFGFNGNISSPSEKARFAFQVDPSQYQFDDDGKVRLLFRVSRADGSTVDPAAIRFISSSPGNRPSIGESRKDFQGYATSMASAKFKPGNYEIEIRSERRSTGAFLVEAFLLGDVNNDRRVNDTDLQMISALKNKKQGQAGYLQAADVNLNGRIDYLDYLWTKNNRGAAVKNSGQGSALEFRSGFDYATIPVSGSLESIFSEQRFTVEAWIQVNQFYDNSWFSVVDGEAWTIQIHSGTGLEIASYNGGTTFFGFVPELGVPYHIAVNYDQARGTVSLFVNGAFYGEREYSGLLESTNAIKLGVNPFGALEYSYGKIDDLRIWSTNRTPQEVQSNYEKELVGNEPGLVGYWKMNEGTGSSFRDSTANGNHGLFPEQPSEIPIWSGGLIGQAWQSTRILYFNSQGDRISNWQYGEKVIVEVTGGTPDLKYVQIHWQDGSAGAQPVVIAQKLNYDYLVGYRFTIETSPLTFAVSISTGVKADPFSTGWYNLETLWRNG